jgi:hypothetical protein
MRCKDGPPPAQRVRRTAKPKKLVESIEETVPTKGFLEEIIEKPPSRKSARPEKIATPPSRKSSCPKDQSKQSLVHEVAYCKEWALSCTGEKLPLWSDGVESMPHSIRMEISIPTVVCVPLVEQRVFPSFLWSAE